MENKQLIEALLEFHKECPKIDKRKVADMQKYQYKFAPLDAILDVIKPILLKNGLFIMQALVGRKTLRTTLFHLSGESISSTFEWDSVSWVFADVGKEITYYKRYAICALLNLSIGDEDQDAQGKMQYKELNKDEKKGLLQTLDKTFVDSRPNFIKVLNNALVKIDPEIWHINLKEYLEQYYILAPGIYDYIESLLCDYRQKYYQ